MDFREEGRARARIPCRLEGPDPGRRYVPWDPGGVDPEGGRGLLPPSLPARRYRPGDAVRCYLAVEDNGVSRHGAPFLFGDESLDRNPDEGVLGTRFGVRGGRCVGMRREGGYRPRFSLFALGGSKGDVER